ncbi:unnamed protein product [Dovyalis caffra]|uniref:Uncharacterized protein n=1 Tax=Dovyalis caffra TaxID=77055 RepID=A0AAV1SC67_9ROSI|nr:unnamed protein product [Dovyalis caffra]
MCPLRHLLRLEAQGCAKDRRRRRVAPRIGVGAGLRALFLSGGQSLVVGITMMHFEVLAKTDGQKAELERVVRVNPVIVEDKGLLVCLQEMGACPKLLLFTILPIISACKPLAGT